MPKSAVTSALVIAMALFAVASFEVAAQSAAASGANGQALTVVKCDPQANSCNEGARRFMGPVLGPDGQATLLSEDLSTTEVEIDAGEYRVLIPGCVPTEPGIFVCESVHQYQHCRTLMFSSFVYSCRAPNPFETDFAGAREASPDEYTIAIDSNARLRVTRGDRSFGQMRGQARVELAFDLPGDVPGGWCLERERFLYLPTGPDGGVSEIDDTADCEEPLVFSFRPHEDDIVRTYNLCDELAAWGSEINESMEILAAGLFHFRSADPEFVSQHASGVAIVAPYVYVHAPLRVDCAE